MINCTTTVKTVAMKLIRKLTLMSTTTGLFFAILNLSNAFCSLTALESVFSCFQLKNIFSTLPPYKQHVFNCFAAIFLCPKRTNLPN